MCLYYITFLVIFRSPEQLANPEQHLRNPEKLATFARCGFRDKTKVLTNLSLQKFAREIHRILKIGIHLHFGTCLNFCL